MSLFGRNSITPDVLWIVLLCIWLQNLDHKIPAAEATIANDSNSMRSLHKSPDQEIELDQIKRNNSGISSIALSQLLLKTATQSSFSSAGDGRTLLIPVESDNQTKNIESEKTTHSDKNNRTKSQMKNDISPEYRRLNLRRPFADLDDQFPDDLVTNNNDDGQVGDEFSSDLRRKAKYFGQTGEEHKKVHDILNRLNIYVSSQHKMNGDREILIEYGTKDNATGSDSDAVHGPDEGTTFSNNNTMDQQLNLRKPNSDPIVSPWNDQRQRDFVNLHSRPPSKDYYQSKRKNSERRAKSSVNGRFGDADDEDVAGGNNSGDWRRGPFTHGAEEMGRHFEGDIVLTLDQAEKMYDRIVHAEDKRKKRKFIATSTRRWNPDKSIEYSFDGSHTIRERNLIELSLEHWQNVTCLTFQRRDDQPRGNRIVFTDVDGCASNVGRNPIEDVQFVSLASECIRLGVIAHEVAHALGFWHEQSRPDRDIFVNVKWNNIEQGSSGQFLKEKPDDVDDEGIPYDYGSIMHYRSKAFAKSDALYTITTNVQDYQRTIGQRDQLSFNDIRLMNKIYCSHKCPTKLKCLRGGYTDPRRCDRCRCPDGFTGKLCDKIMPGYGATCGGEIPMNSLYYYFNSPNYPSPFDEGQECSWLLKAPVGQSIEVEFVGPFDLYCKIEHSLCMDYVEIRNTSDFANTGMRFCCYSAPRGRILSETNDLLVLFRSFYRSGVGFKARARAVNLRLRA